MVRRGGGSCRPAPLTRRQGRRAPALYHVAGPEVLLLDEPTATLDRVTADRIGTLLAMLGRDRTVLVATHDPALIAVADHRLELGRADPRRAVPAGA